MFDDLNIRAGVPSDIHQLMDLAMNASKELAFVNYDPEKILAEIWAALHQESGIVGVIGPVDGQIEGAVLLRVGAMWYSSEKVLEEKGIFIHPDFRSSRAHRGRRLCEFSKRVADQLGMPLIIGILSNDRLEAKARLYERQFGKPSGTFFLYGATPGTGLVKEH
jgi:hypothetical protein